MANNNNQHFVPKFYLRGFSLDKASVNLMRITDGLHIKKASIRGQCSKNKYYNKDPKLDDFLRFLESQASSFMRLFVGEVPSLGISEKQLEYFLCFLTTQMHRTPQAQENGIEIHKQSKDVIIKSAPKGAILPKELDAAPMDHVDMVRIATKIYPHLFDMMMVVVDAPKNVEFITSDNPVVLFNRAGELGKVDENIGLGAAGLILAYPINAEHLLLMYDEGSFKCKLNAQMRVRANAADVRRLNDLQFLNAIHSVYFIADNKDFEKQRLRAMKRRETTRVLVEEFIETSFDNGRSFVRKFDGSATKRNKKSSIIGFSQKPLNTGFSSSFLKIRKRLQYDDNGSIVGTQRNREFFKLGSEYNKLLKSGKIEAFTFSNFLNDNV